MSSPPKEKVETKGGHPPAVKAGGMRIVQKHQAAAAPEPPQKDDDEEYVSSSPPKVPVIVSGVVTKELLKDYRPPSTTDSGSMSCTDKFQPRAIQPSSGLQC
uniref:Death-associated protein n=1 Tax=Echeneis naucrates TaxID=173247 RepID=A0A665V1M0_ECHNA